MQNNVRLGSPQNGVSIVSYAHSEILSDRKLSQVLSNFVRVSVNGAHNPDSILSESISNNLGSYWTNSELGNLDLFHVDVSSAAHLLSSTS
jgi:hypothetical protein